MVMVMRLVMHASRIPMMVIRAVHSLTVLTVLVIHHITLILSTVVPHTMIVFVMRSTPTELGDPFATVTTHC